MEDRLALLIRGERKEYPSGTLYRRIAEEYQEEYQNPIVLVSADGRLRELHHEAEEGAAVEFITLGDKAGFDAYRRSMTLLLLKAVYHVAGDNSRIERVGIHFALGDGFYCTMQGEIPLNQEFLDQVKASMREMVEKALPIEKHAVPTYEAVKKFREYRMYDKEQLFYYRRSSRVNLYSLDRFEDYFYGYMVPDTSYLKVFDLQLFQEGFVLLFPDRSDPEHLVPFKPDYKIFHVQQHSMEWGKKLGIPTVGALNHYIVHHKAKELIMIQEAYHEKQIAEMAEQIAEDSEKKIVLIAGPSSSGKTTFSHRLSTQLSVYGLKPYPIAADDYFVNRENTPLDEEGKPDFECLEAIDAEQLNKDMLALLQGETVEIPTFNFKTGKREYKGNFKTMGREDILIIEGIHCLNDKLTWRLPRENKCKIYISALTQLNIDEHNRIPTTDGRLLRRLVRDARTRGADARKTLGMWGSVRRGEENHIFPFQEEADMMFNSALIYELAVLKMYAEPLLFSIRQDEQEYQEAKRLLKFLDYFLPIPSDDIPNNSLIREFIGGGCFKV